MVALDLNLPFKQAGLVPVRLPVILTGTRNTVVAQRLSKKKNCYNWSIST